MSLGFLLCESGMRVNETVPVAPTELKDEGRRSVCFM